MSSTLSHLSESSKLSKKKTSPAGTVIELFSTVTFLRETRRKCISNCVKRRNVVSVIAWQQTYCASNLEQVGGGVPAPSVLRKAKLWNDSRNCWRNAGETLEMILAWCTSPQKSYHDLKEIDTIPDASFVLSVLVRSTLVKGRLVWISVYKSEYNGRKRTSMQLRHIILI